MATADPDEIAFSDFMAARWNALFRTAYLITGDRHEAEDLLQTAMAKTFVAWKRVRAKEAADAYVRRVMVNTAASRWKRGRRETIGYNQDGTVVCVFRRKVMVPKDNYLAARGGDQPGRPTPKPHD